MSCSGSHLGITINIKNTNFVKDLPMIDAQSKHVHCELVIVALMQNKLFISYNILWQEQVTFDDDDCVRFVIDQHTKLNFCLETYKKITSHKNADVNTDIKMYEFTFMCSA
jgi:hypothetical protein